MSPCHSPSLRRRLSSSARMASRVLRGGPEAAPQPVERPPQEVVVLEATRQPHRLGERRPRPGSPTGPQEDQALAHERPPPPAPVAGLRVQLQRLPIEAERLLGAPLGLAEAGQGRQRPAPLQRPGQQRQRRGHVLLGLSPPSAVVLDVLPRGTRASASSTGAVPISGSASASS